MPSRAKDSETEEVMGESKGDEESQKDTFIETLTRIVIS